MTLAPSLEDACRRWSARPAIAFHGQTITYARLWEQVSRLAAAYDGLGVAPGDRVVCQLPNRPEHIVAIGAAWSMGAVHAGTDSDLTAAELAGLLDQLDAAVLLYAPRPGTADPLGVLADVRAARPNTTIIVAGPPPQGLDQLAGVHALDDLLGAPAARGERALPPAAEPTELAVLHLTSGTTGQSKAVRESRAAFWAKTAFFADAVDAGPDDVHLIFLPVAHVFGMRLALIPLLTGGRLVLLDRFSPSTAMDLVSDERVTILPGMPTHLTLLLRAFDRQRHRVEQLRFVITAAAALPAKLAAAVYDSFDAELLYVFGCAEGFTTRTTDRDEILRGSVGRVVHGPEGTADECVVRIAEPSTGELLPVGEVGEIVFSAARPVHYWGAPDTATDGWYHTGDLGRMDETGAVYVVGRLKELVNRGGLKVAPSEIEAAIVRHAAVLDAGVVGTPDPVLGEAICACVVPRDGDVLDLAQLRGYLGSTLARHKLPDELCAVAQVPRTKIGKVDRPALTALVVEGDLPRERLRPR